LKKGIEQKFKVAKNEEGVFQAPGPLYKNWSLYKKEQTWKVDQKC
jgi:hypothetical protein